MSKIIMNYNETKQTNTGAKPNNTPDDIHYGLQGVFESDVPENPEQPGTPEQPEEQQFLHNINFRYDDYSDFSSYLTLVILSNSDVAITIDDLVAMVPNDGDIKTIPGVQKISQHGQRYNEATIRHSFTFSGSGEHHYEICGDDSPLCLIRVEYDNGGKNEWYIMEDTVSELQESDTNERAFRIKTSGIVEADFDNLKAALTRLSNGDDYYNISCGSFIMYYGHYDETVEYGFGVMPYNHIYFSIFLANGEPNVDTTADAPTDILVLPQSFIDSCTEQYGFDILEVLSPFILEELN